MRMVSYCESSVLIRASSMLLADELTITAPQRTNFEKLSYIQDSGSLTGR
jgi:hypothetical protein